MRKFACLLLLLTVASSVWADQIALGGTAATATSGPPVYNNETQSIGTGSDIWMYLKGNAVSSEPVLLILGVPNDNGTLLNSTSISGVKLWNSSQTTSVTGTLSPFSGSTGYASITSHNSFGYAGSFSSGDLYNSFFGISSITASNQFQSNWQAWDQQLFPALYPAGQPANFAIYVYGFSFSGADFASKGDNYIEASLPSGLPQGTYAVGYSLDTSSNNGSDNFTPFTVAGLTTTKTPEPGSLLLLGSGLAGLGLLRRRK